MLQRMAFYTMQYTSDHIENKKAHLNTNPMKDKDGTSQNEISYLKIYSSQWLALFYFLLILWKLCYTHFD